MIITLGLLSGLLTTCAWLPQLLRTWRRGRADDISYTYLAVFAAGVLGWLAYGLVAEQPAVFAANVVTFTLIVALALLKTHPAGPGPPAPLSGARSAVIGRPASERPPAVPDFWKSTGCGALPGSASSRLGRLRSGPRIRAWCLLLAASFLQSR